MRDKGMVAFPQKSVFSNCHTSESHKNEKKVAMSKNNNITSAWRKQISCVLVKNQ